MRALFFAFLVTGLLFSCDAGAPTSPSTVLTGEYLARENAGLPLDARLTDFSIDAQNTPLARFTPYGTYSYSVSSKKWFKIPDFTMTQTFDGNIFVLRNGDVILTDTSANGALNLVRRKNGTTIFDPLPTLPAIPGISHNSSALQMDGLGNIYVGVDLLTLNNKAVWQCYFLGKNDSSWSVVSLPSDKQHNEVHFETDKSGDYVYAYSHGNGLFRVRAGDKAFERTMDFTTAGIKAMELTRSPAGQLYLFHSNHVLSALSSSGTSLELPDITMPAIYNALSIAWSGNSTAYVLAGKTSAPTSPSWTLLQLTTGSTTWRPLGLVGSNNQLFVSPDGTFYLRRNLASEVYRIAP